MHLYKVHFIFGLRPPFSVSLLRWKPSQLLPVGRRVGVIGVSPDYGKLE